jgi:nucleotide-binding universal stress UspA family protein
MFKIPAIVCATDLSEGSNKSLHLASFIASHYESRLIVAHVIDLPAVTPYGETMVDPQELQLRVAQSAREQITDILCDVPPANWELKVTIGYPVKEIQQIINQTGAGLLLASTHIRGGIERLLLGSVTRKLMFTLKVPFLVVPGSLPLERTSLHRIESILISTDFSPESLEAVKWGIDFTRVFNARATLVNVIESTQLDLILTSDPQKEKAVAQKCIDDLSQKLQALVPQDLTKNVTVKVLAGHPHEELNKFAILNHIDLIVVGVHGRGFIENLMVGSTTDRLVRLGQFPIMAVRSENHQLW